MWRAKCKPLDEVVAIKILDLERQDPGKLVRKGRPLLSHGEAHAQPLCAQEEIRKEAQTMSLLNHPNLVSCYCSFVSGPVRDPSRRAHARSLAHSSCPARSEPVGGDALLRRRVRAEHHEVQPRAGTSRRAGGLRLATHRAASAQGLDENVIATVMEPVVRALSYFHRNGNIHRDIKAGNILIDDHGNVKLADYGVATSGFGSFSAGAHQTFVGTPCWCVRVCVRRCCAPLTTSLPRMAPEVMEQSHGYDQQADIWSLGITLLELAHGHAPFAKYPPMKVLMMTLQNPPPTVRAATPLPRAPSPAAHQPPPQLGADSPEHRFSRHLRDLVAQCLQKDPKKRPSAKALLEHRFFKEKAGKPDFLVKMLLEGIPPLGERVKELHERENARRGAAMQSDIKSQSQCAPLVSQARTVVTDSSPPQVRAWR